MQRVYVYWHEKHDLRKRLFGHRYSALAMQRAEHFIEALAYRDIKGEIKYR